MADTITPTHLARELGVDARTVRQYLRDEHSAGHIANARWMLSPEQADAVRARFGRRSR